MIPAVTDYAGLWSVCAITPAATRQAQHQAAAIVAARATYAQVGDPLGVPFWFVGCIHWMERSGDFSTHLHNGDPLTHRTVHVPAGRPLTGVAPFSWSESARDALTMQGLNHVSGWSIPVALARAELWNGLGYRARGIRSPYLWSGTSLEQAGRFVKDGVFDPAARSAQIGVVAMMMELVAGGMALDGAMPVTADDLNDAEAKRLGV